MFALICLTEIHLKTIALFYQGLKEDTTHFASELVPSLRKQGHHVRMINLQEEGEDYTGSEIKDSDLALVLGGDGTIIHAARLCARVATPIVGVNFGRVGFLTELEPHDVTTHLPYYLNGDASVWVDERTMLSAILEQNGHQEEFLALNDIVIARGTWPRIVQIRVWIDGYYYNTSFADGMIISTATGSTAYNMAVGGPLLHPQVRNSVLTPIATHLASDRSLVLQPEANIKLQIFTHHQNGAFSADGQLNREIKDGALVSVHRSPFVTKFLRRRPPTYFYQIITAKLKENSIPASDSHVT